MDGTGIRISRMTKWSALISVGALVLLACQPDDPTPAPTDAATAEPSTAPIAATIEPTAEPTSEPTPDPTPEPTQEPTPEPAMTAEPTPTDEPLASAEPAVMEPAVNGTIILPEGSTLAGATEWSLEIQDTSLTDAPAVVIGKDAAPVVDETAMEISFAAKYDAEAIEEGNTYTLSARIVDADGNLLFINDTSIPVLTNGAPTDDVDVPVIQTSGVSPMASEAPPE